LLSLSFAGNSLLCGDSGGTISIFKPSDNLLHSSAADDDWSLMMNCIETTDVSGL
jgi:hypothetical protein